MYRPSNLLNKAAAFSTPIPFATKPVYLKLLFSKELSSFQAIIFGMSTDMFCFEIEFDVNTDATLGACEISIENVMLIGDDAFDITDIKSNSNIYMMGIDNILDIKKKEAQENWLDNTSLEGIANIIDSKISEIRDIYVNDDYSETKHISQGALELIEKFKELFSFHGHSR